jgi:hypothetical protein
MSKPRKVTRRDTRTADLTIPVTPEEKKLFFAMARWHHKTLAQLVRDLLYREERVSKVA